MNVRDQVPEKMNESVSDASELRWQCHPVRRKPVVSALVSVFVVVICMLVLYSTESQMLTLLGMVVLFASLAKFYFPTSYELSDQGITVKTTTQTLKKRWSQYRSCWPDKNGVLLSPFVERSRLENFRGQYLMFEGNRDEVIRYIEEHLGKPDEPEAGEDET